MPSRSRHRTALERVNPHSPEGQYLRMEKAIMRKLHDGDRHDRLHEKEKSAADPGELNISRLPVELQLAIASHLVDSAFDDLLESFEESRCISVGGATTFKTEELSGHNAQRDCARCRRHFQRKFRITVLDFVRGYPHLRWDVLKELDGLDVEAKSCMKLYRNMGRISMFIADPDDWESDEDWEREDEARERWHELVEHDEMVWTRIQETVWRTKSLIKCLRASSSALSAE